MPGTEFLTDELLHEHSQALRSLARSLLRDHTAAEDALQDTWIVALERPPIQQSAPGSWLRRVLRSCASNLQRTNRRRMAHERQAALNRRSRGADTAATLEALTHALLRLPNEVREVVMMRYFEGLPPRAISDHLEVPVKTVHSRLRRGLQKLRRNLGRHDPEQWKLNLAALFGPTLPTPTASIRVQPKTNALSSRWVPATAVAMSAAVGAWSCLASGDPTSLERAVVVRATPAVTLATSQAKPLSRMPIPPTAVGLIVTDAKGTAVANAKVSGGPVFRRWLPARSLTKLGSTSRTGRLDLPVASLRRVLAAGRTIYVHHEEFVTREVSKTEIQRTMRTSAPLSVRMVAGHDQEFEFRTPEGHPIAEQVIRISRCRSLRTALPRGLPGARFDAVHLATSDAEGVARFRRLPPGLYAFRGGAGSHYAAVSGPGGRSRTFSVPGPSEVFTVRPILAGGVIVQGDRIITGRAEFDGIGFRNPLRQLDPIRASLRERWNTECAHVGIQRRGTPRMRWALLLERTGWHTGETTMAPLLDHPGPSKLVIVAARPSRPTGQVLLQWSGDGPAPRLDLERHDAPNLDPREKGRKTRSIIELTPGKPLHLPIGDYLLNMRYPMERQLFEFKARKVSIRVGETTNLRLSRPASARTFFTTLRSPGGEPIERPDAVVVEHGDAVVWRSFEFHANRLRVVAPMGRCTLRVKALGYRELVKDFHVTKTAPRLLDYRLEFDDSDR